MGSFVSTAYSRREWSRAVNLSAWLGWAGFIAPFVDLERPEIFGLFAVVGLPISFLVVWLIGAPILRRIMRKSVSWFEAACGGALVAGVLVFLSIAIGRFLGWLKFRNPNSWSQHGGGDFVTEIDGILTGYGWKMLALASLKFVVLGVVVGLIVRGIIGPGSNRQTTD